MLGELEIPEGRSPLGEDELVNIFERSKMALNSTGSADLIFCLAEEVARANVEIRFYFLSVCLPVCLFVRLYVCSIMRNSFQKPVLQSRFILIQKSTWSRFCGKVLH